MAEHNDGNRGKSHDNSGGRSSGGAPFRGTSNSGGDPRGFRSREDRDRKPYGDRAPREGGDQRGFGNSERKPYSGGGERKPYGDRAPREGGGQRSFGGDSRPSYGDRKPYSGGGERKPYGDRAPREGGGQRSFGGDSRPSYGDRKPYSGGGDRDRKPYGDRAPREGGGQRSFGGGGDRDRKPYSGGENRKPFGTREDRPARGFDRGDSGPRQYGRDRPEDRPVRVPNARDLRSANRPDRERSPQIDEDVTGKELDRATQHQIKTLEDNSAEWVARHLVMAGRLLDEEPELAFQHALAASRRGGRLAAVREAVGLTAYAAGHYGEALREFRTYRRISGSNMHLPVMADCERGLGRPDRALDVVRSEEANDLDAPGKVELAIVASGARADLGQLDAAVAELEIQQLDINRAFSYSPRLFRAYADA